MIGLGTLINVACILAGGVVGLLGGRFLIPRMQDTLMKATGLCIIFVGVAGTLEQMLTVQNGALASGGTAMMIVSFALGSAIGEAIDFDRRFEQLGIWLKQKTGSGDDAGFVNGFVNASLTVSIGAMAIVGSIQDGIAGDWSTLALKGALDAIIVCVMTASLGRGCIFSALPVAVIQGAITLLAQPIRPIMTAAALSSLPLVGSMLIFCVGINLIWKNTFKPANMLPAVVIAVIWALVMP
ncbi:DUF554 domain-containing protein [Collinsella tanakaei]|uniref:DUF554 domain-containing protein n=1 Tax=Collinsella tanakaei TaxID=626935 RepID=UPI00195DA127|nr:DUF554 domain-containing protein [Collinsella tanakaei]MBM6756387.1 DUF554 domain-containing protein [Collinsella tanakaei]